VLERHRLAAVAQRDDGGYELLGSRSGAEDAAWKLVEERGRLDAAELHALLGGEGERSALDGLIRRRVVFADPATGAVHALSRLAARPA
jgi:hypothetical protein